MALFSSLICLIFDFSPWSHSWELMQPPQHPRAGVFQPQHPDFLRVSPILGAVSAVRSRTAMTPHPQNRGNTMNKRTKSERDRSFTSQGQFEMGIASDIVSSLARMLLPGTLRPAHRAIKLPESSLSSPPFYIIVFSNIFQHPDTTTGFPASGITKNREATCKFLLHFILKPKKLLTFLFVFPPPTLCLWSSLPLASDIWFIQL